MARKGRLEEIFSMAMHSGKDPAAYVVSYRDFDKVIELTLPEFVQISENFEVIPATRILLIKKGSDVLYRKHGFIPR